MLARLAALALSFAVPLSLVPAQVAAPAGAWSGAIELPGDKLEVHVTLTRSDSAWQGSIDIPAQAAKNLPLEKIAVDGRKVTFAIAGVPGAPTFAGELGQDGTAISGTFTQGAQSFPFALKQAPSVSFDGVQAFVDDLRQKFHVPGCAIAVVEGGDVVTTIVSGERDVEHGLAVTPDTLFAIGSSTKAFTTLLLATLVDEGRLDWDRPVRTWIPEFALEEHDAGEHLTPRDLVTHRSGMPRHDLVWYGATISRAEMVRRLRWLPLNKDLRTEFQYNNLMFLTAGYLAERVAGRTWEELVRQRIFAPLGMSRSNFEVVASAADEDHAEPYRYDDDKLEHIPFRDLTAIGPAGSINSSVREMARWVALHLQNGKHGDTAIVQPSSMNELHTVRMPIGDDAASPDLVSVGYALGWFVDVYRGARRVHHGGNIDGFSALVAFLPDKDWGFVVLTNLDGTPLPEMVVRRLSDRVLGVEDKDWAGKVLAKIERTEAEVEQGKKNEAGERHSGTRPSHDLADYVGGYSHPGYGACTVTHDGDELRIAFHGLGAAMEHWHYDVFRCRKDASAPGIEGTKVQFTTSFDGDIDALRAALEPATDPIVFTRQADAQLRDPGFLRTLVGDYQLPGQTVKFAMQGDQLTVELPGQFYVLGPRRNLTFDLIGLHGFSVRFVLDAHGRAVRVRIRQPNGVFEAERKAAK
ncbi:MAG TPA: serine hydrolase [Planctomycetota bacterium]|nr:serine hydrolase [Planctomycetota bacterium]